jgi:tRNA modification GTPase
VFSPTDTIAAIATPPGRGGIGVVRVSGPSALAIARALLAVASLTPRYATLAAVRAPGCGGARRTVGAIDEVLATYFPAPHSYTGEDVIEISAHGSPPVLTQILEAAMEAGARLAEPGEFTFRAYLHGRLDLIQAEAVADLVDAVSPRQARAAFDQLQGGLTRAIGAVHDSLFDLIARLEASLDFPDEGYHFVGADVAHRELLELQERLDRLLSSASQGRLIREGAHVVIAGRANVGKSSLFNRLAGAERAIVAEAPGTTRDMITENVVIEGIPLTLVDTAGIRLTDDAVEREGVSRAQRSLEIADVVVLVFDRSVPLEREDTELVELTSLRNRVIALNKVDLPAGHVSGPEGPVVPVSAITGEGLDQLRRTVVTALTGDGGTREDVTITNVRHIRLLRETREAVARARTAAASGLSEEFVLTDLQRGRALLEEVTGARTPEDILAHIFSRFCIGK